MIVQYHKIAFLAGFALAMSFIFSCSSDGGGGGGDTPSSSSLAVLLSSSSLMPSSSSLYPSSSSSYPSSSSSPSEYTGGSCNAADYGSVNINGQIWMKKNWGCYASGSKCYGNDPANCDTYGRLYDWSTAMGIDSRYNSEVWGGSDVKHQGICPSGWHIPSNADWDKLMRYVDGTNGTSSPYDSPTAGKYLKAKDGWYNCGPSGSGKSYSCEDTHGFSALPGGYGSSGGSFVSVGSSGLWWSASEGDSYSAYRRGMLYLHEYAYWGSSSKDGLFSVRCLQD